MYFSRFTQKSKKVIELSLECAREFGHNRVDSEHLLLGLSKEGDGVASRVLLKLGITPKYIEGKIIEKKGIIPIMPIDLVLSPRSEEILEISGIFADKFKSEYIETEHILLGILQQGENLAVNILKEAGIDDKSIVELIIDTVGLDSVTTNKESKPNYPTRTQTSLKILDKYGKNLTLVASQNKIDPVIGREKEIERAIQILSRRTKNNPVFIGDPGVGKTSVAEGLAANIASGNVPDNLIGKVLYTLDMGSMLAGAKYRGEFEERIKQVVDEVVKNGNIILFIDELHTIIGAGSTGESTIDASNILKPVLSRGDIQIIGATTIDEYRKHIEKDSALERRFQPVLITEPTKEETIKILEGLREKYESLPLATLKDLAKARGLKGISTMKKAELIERMLEEDEKEKKSARETVKELSANTGDKEVHDIDKLDSGITAHGILEVMQDGYGFIRSANYLPGENDVYVSPSQIRRFNLKTGDILEGNTRIKTQQEKFSALLYLSKINEMDPMKAMHRKNFEDMTPIFPNERLSLECGKTSTAMRIMDLMSPIGKGQRGMIVSPPKAGKTTLLKQVALSVQKNNPEVHLLILLIDERPEEVTDIRESIEGPNVEVIYSTFDELPEHHKRVSEMVIERAKRLVEHKKDVMILIDSITRLARAYNLTVPPSGRTLSGGLDPAALHMPKRFFGAARNMREGGSLTILATALVDTGSKMDDVVYEEFKGTGNMELVLDRKLSEKRMFPAIDILKSGTRREDLLLSKEEQEAVESMRRALNGLRPEEAVDNILNMFSRTRNNEELIQMVKKTKFI